MSTLSETRPRAALAVMGGVVAVVLVIVGSFLIFGGSDDGGSAAPSELTSSPPASVETSEPASAAPDFNYLAQARQAAKDGVAVLVPTDLPRGWAVVSAAYQGGNSPSWNLVMTNADGTDVVVDQREASVDDLLAEVAPGAVAGESVNLNRWQTGVWQGYDTEAGAALGQGFKSTAVVLTGADM